MRTSAKRALLSVLLGVVGIVCAQTGSAGLVWGIVMGLASLGTGIQAARLTFKPGGFSWGKIPVLLGALLGILASLLCLLISTSMVAHFLMQPQFPQDWQNHGPPPGIVNPMPDQSATSFTSNLPIIVMDASSGPNGGTGIVPVRARFYDLRPARAAVEGPPDQEVSGTIRIRGYSTRNLPKHSYTFHLVDEQNNQVKKALLGLPPGSDWVLYAPYEDKTMMRDVLAFDLTRQMGHYAPRTRYVELFIQTGASPLSMRDYEGVYVLVEKIQRGQDRVDIAKLEPKDNSEPEISGGYIVKRDHPERAESHFRTSRGGPYFYVYPKAEKITARQKEWLRAYFEAFEQALYSDNFQDPQEGYSAYLDVDAFIDAHWLIEVAKNIDGFRYSAHLTKDRSGKLKPGPPWDWNRAFGNANYHTGGQTHGWYWSLLRPSEINWYQRLRQDPRFSQRCAKRWHELRQEALDIQRIQRRIDQLAAQLEEAQQRNFARWPVLGHQVTCNFYVGKTYQDEVEWLKNWIEHRIQWIDQQVENSSQ